MDTPLTSRIKNELQKIREKKKREIFRQNKVLLASYVRENRERQMNQRLHSPFNSVITSARSRFGASIQENNRRSKKLSITTIPAVKPLPTTFTWTLIQRNIPADDEPELKYLPYVNDDKLIGSVYLEKLASRYYYCADDTPSRKFRPPSIMELIELMDALAPRGSEFLS